MLAKLKTRKGPILIVNGRVVDNVPAYVDAPCYLSPLPPSAEGSPMTIAAHRPSFMMPPHGMPILFKLKDPDRLNQGARAHRHDHADRHEQGWVLVGALALRCF